MAELLRASCEAAQPHLQLTNVVLWKRIGGSSRTIAWHTANAPAATRLAAREQAWTNAAELVARGTRRADPSPRRAAACVEDAAIGVSAMLWVESERALDDCDRQLIHDLLRGLLYTDGN